MNTEAVILIGSLGASLTAIAGFIYAGVTCREPRPIVQKEIVRKVNDEQLAKLGQQATDAARAHVEKCFQADSTPGESYVATFNLQIEREL